MKQYSFNGLAGCVQQRRARQNGALIGIYNAEQAQVDASDAWIVVCEEHNEMASFPTLAMARYYAAEPLSWCSQCRGNDA